MIAVLTSAKPKMELATRVSTELHRSAITSTTLSEWLYGVHSIRDITVRDLVLAKVKRLLRVVEVIPFEQADALVDVDLRFGVSQRHLTADTVQAATAVKRRLVMVTFNVKHFKPFEAAGLKLESW